MKFNETLHFGKKSQKEQGDTPKAELKQNNNTVNFIKSLALSGLLFSVAREAKSQDGNHLDSLKNNIEISKYLMQEKEKFKQEVEKYKEYGMFLGSSLVFEKPTIYQKEQIKILEDSILSDIENKDLNSMIKLVAYINQAIDANFSTNENTIYLKDAFPEKPGGKPKGSFDCDSRALMCLSILNKKGITNKQISFCLLEDHALLHIKSENTFFEMTNNKPRQLTEDEILQLDEINSLDKYYAYLLGKEGIALSYEADGNIFSDEKKDKEKMLLALQKIQMAAELDHDNLNTNLNLLKMLSKFPSSYYTPEQVGEISNNIKRNLLNHFYHINTEEMGGKIIVIQPQEISNQKIMPRYLEDLGSLEDLTIKALVKNDYLNEKFADLGFDLFYNFNNYKEALPIFESLAKSINLKFVKEEKNKSKDYCFYKEMISRCYFNTNQYEKYLSSVHWNTTFKIVWAWLFTIPAAAFIGGFIFYILKIIF